MDIINDDSSKMALLLGEAASLKTTFLFHYAYLIIEKLKQLQDKSQMSVEEDIHGVILCNQNKLEENTFYFGKYSEVFIGHLRQIKLKYVRSYEDIINFLTYFRKIPNKPKFVFIDEPSSYLKTEGIESRLSKLAYLYHLLKKVCQQITSERENYFKIIVVEPIKPKELENTHKDKENFCVYQKYFSILLCLKSKRITSSGIDEVKLRRVVYNREAEEKQRILEAFEYKDSYLESILGQINEGLQS